MKETRLLMGMPITIEIVDPKGSKNDINDVFEYFTYIDNKFSTYKDSSEITRYNSGEIKEDELSEDMRLILDLADKTKDETNGYFDIKREDGSIEPAGIVKGWAIYNASKILNEKDLKNFFIDAGGDIHVSGKNKEGNKWRIGIRNPFNRDQLVKVIQIEDMGIATSGTYIRGNHIYNPKNSNSIIDEIVSLTVIGPNVYEADRFATAAFAMGKDGIKFIEKLSGFEGYMIDKSGMAVMTTGFNSYVTN